MAAVTRFVPNEADDKHCFQASYIMVVEALSTIRKSMKDAEKETGFVAGHSTWAFEGMLSLAEQGFKITYVDKFDVEAFARDPRSVLIDLYGRDIADKIEARSDLSKLGNIVKRWQSHPHIKFEERAPEIYDIRKSISNGSRIIVNINSKILQEKLGYLGHFVVVDKIMDSLIVLQNPGLPPMQNQKISIEKFEKAWMYPDKKAANLIIVGK